MVLKCKLQKAVPTAIAEKSDKFLFGFFSLSNPFLLVLSFLGVIGAYIWYTSFSAPPSTRESESQKENEKKQKRNKETNETQKANIKEESLYSTLDSTSHNQTIETTERILEQTKSIEIVQENIKEITQETAASSDEEIIASTDKSSIETADISKSSTLAVDIFETKSSTNDATVEEIESKIETIDKTIDLIASQVVADNNNLDNLTNVSTCNSNNTLNDLSSDELNEFSSDETNERLLYHLNYNAIEQAIDMVSNYSTRVNKSTSELADSINVESSSSRRATITKLNEDLLINEQTVEQAINLITTLKNQQQQQQQQEQEETQIESTTTTSSVITTQQTESNSLEKLNEYVIVDKEVVDAPVELLTNQLLEEQSSSQLVETAKQDLIESNFESSLTSIKVKEKEEDVKEESLGIIDNAIASIADALQAITNEMKSSVVEDNIIRETKNESIEQEKEEILSSETTTFKPFSNMKNVLEKIKETLDEEMKLLDEAESESLVEKIEQQVESKDETAIIDDETSQIISVGETIKEIANEMSAIVKDTVSSIIEETKVEESSPLSESVMLVEKEEYNSSQQNEIENIIETVTTSVSEQISESVNESAAETLVETLIESSIQPAIEPLVESINEPLVESINESLVEPAVEPLSEIVAEVEKSIQLLNEVVNATESNESTITTTNLDTTIETQQETGDLIEKINEPSQLVKSSSSPCGFIPRVDDILPVLAGEKNHLHELNLEASQTSEAIRHSIEKINLLSGNLKVKFQIAKPENYGSSRSLTFSESAKSDFAVKSCETINRIVEEQTSVADVKEPLEAEVAIEQPNNIQKDEPLVEQVVEQQEQTSSDSLDQTFESCTINQVVETLIETKTEENTGSQAVDVEKVTSTLNEHHETHDEEVVNVEQEQQHVDVSETKQKISNVIEIASSSSYNQQSQQTIIETSSVQESISAVSAVLEEILTENQITQTIHVEQKNTTRFSETTDSLQQNEQHHQQTEEKISTMSIITNEDSSPSIVTKLETRSEEKLEVDLGEIKSDDIPENKPLEKRQNSLLELYNAKHIHAIEDHFNSLEEVSDAIKRAGLERSQLVFGIDFTISNLENGARTFNGRSLHYYDETIRNPYQKVIEILGKTLENFDIDGRIPAYGFGDSQTKDRKVFPFSETGFCLGFNDVLDRYNKALKTVRLSGPTNFAPLIKETIRIVKETKQYHILVIVADGQVTNERQTRDAIVEASNYPISIIMVGVGDGPWDTMNEFDDSIPKRQFDNFQFVDYHEVTSNTEKPDEMFALNALMEIPDQYKAIKELNLLRD